MTLIATVREAMDDKRFAIFRPDPTHNLCDGRYVISVALPLGLMTIAKRLEGSYYRTALAFKSDVDLLASNCELFNGTGEAITDTARTLQRQLLASLPAHAVVLPPPPLFPSPPPLVNLPPIPPPPRGARTPETRRRGR